MIALLFSYAYMRKGNPRVEGELLVQECAAAGVRVLIDSGAFTAFHNGRPIDLDQYLDFLNRLHPSIWGAIQLDRINDPAGTAENLRISRDAGADVIPVLTATADLDDLTGEMLDAQGRIAVAGATMKRFAGHEQYIIDRYAEVKARLPQARVHALGFDRYPEILTAPVCTADSSRLVSGARYGNLAIRGQIQVRLSGTWGRPFRRLPVELVEYLLACNVTEKAWTEGRKADQHIGRRFAQIGTCHEWLWRARVVMGMSGRQVFGAIIPAVRITLVDVAAAARFGRVDGRSFDWALAGAWAAEVRAIRDVERRVQACADALAASPFRKVLPVPQPEMAVA